MRPSRPLAPFQFPLRSLFFLTLAVAVLAAIIRILPIGVWYLLVIPVMPIVALSCSILGVIYLRGQWRAFWLGFGTGIVQVIALGLYVDVLPGAFPMRDWEAILIVPFFVVVVPSLTGGIGVWLYVRGQAAQMLEVPMSEGDGEPNEDHPAQL